MKRILVTTVMLALVLGCTVAASDEKVHPQVMPEDYEWGMWIAPETPPGDQFESYAERLLQGLSGAQFVAYAGLSAPAAEIVHTHAQVVIHVLEGLSGPNGGLVEAGPSSGNTIFRDTDGWEALQRQYNGAAVFFLRGGLLWVIDWALPQLDAYAMKWAPSDPQLTATLQQEARRIQQLMLRARGAAVECIAETNRESASAKLLEVSAYLSAAIGSQAPPPHGGLYYLTHVLLGWTWFGP